MAEKYTASPNVSVHLQHLWLHSIQMHNAGNPANRETGTSKQNQGFWRVQTYMYQIKANILILIVSYQTFPYIVYYRGPITAIKNLPTF